MSARFIAGTLSLALLAANAPAAKAQPTARAVVSFGVNGHPLAARGTYAGSLEQQIAWVKSLGLTTYRVNVNPAKTDTFARLEQLVAIAQRQRVTILPVVVIKPSAYTDEATAFADAESKMAGLAKAFAPSLSVWELGNEYDLYALTPGADGTMPESFDTQRYGVVRGLIRGMLAGLRASDASATSIVETSKSEGNAVDSGFLERLIGDGVTFDDVAYHYYDRDGHIPTTKGPRKQDALQILHDTFHKPIWITEFDRSSSGPDMGPSTDAAAQAAALALAMHAIATEATIYDVVNADIYELLDQPELANEPNVKPNQAQFGILGADGSPTLASAAVLRFTQGR